MAEFISSLFGALIGGMVGYLASRTLATKNDRLATTDRLVAEFLSREFLVHRASLDVLRRNLASGDVDIEEVAAGFWYPGRDDYYQGETSGDFNTHQHLTAYIGYIVRLAHAFQHKRLDRYSARGTLALELLYFSGPLQELADEVLRQTQECNARAPQWIEAVRLVEREMVSTESI